MASAKRWFDYQFPQQAPLVILHPNLSSQHALLPQFLDHDDKTTLAVSFHHAPADLPEAWATFAQALNEQQGMQLPAMDGRMTPRSAAENSLRAVKGLAPFLLFIDAFDRVADNESICAWIAVLVRNLPNGCQIVLGGRRLPLALLGDDSVREKTVLFPVDPDRMLLDYADPPEGRILLEVYGHGPGFVLVNGRPIDQWDGVLPRALFFYFVDRGMVTRDEIFRTFWPSLPTREATNVFHVTKRKISEILGFDLTTYWSGFYRISQNIDLHYDVVKFIEGVQNSAVANEEDATVLLQRAIDLYHGTFLVTLNAPWLEPRREELQSTYVDALTGLARLYEHDGRDAEALGLYMRAASTQPHREDLARAIMQIYDRLGQTPRALEVYERLAGELKRRLDVKPDRRTIELADQIRGKRRAKAER